MYTLLSLLLAVAVTFLAIALLTLVAPLELAKIEEAVGPYEAMRLELPAKAKKA